MPWSWGYVQNTGFLKGFLKYGSSKTPANRSGNRSSMANTKPQLHVPSIVTTKILVAYSQDIVSHISNIQLHYVDN